MFFFFFFQAEDGIRDYKVTGVQTCALPNPISRDSGAVAFIWQTPPESAASFNDAQFALNGSVDSMLAKVQATNGTFTESGLSLMMPPDYGKLPVLRNQIGRAHV